MVDGSLAVVRGGERRRHMIELSRTDPGEVDRLLAARKPALEEAVAGHSGLLAALPNDQDNDRETAGAGLSVTERIRPAALGQGGLPRHRGHPHRRAGDRLEG